MINIRNKPRFKRKRRGHIKRRHVRRIVFKRSGLKATGIFVILLSQDGFESNCSDRPVLEYLSNKVVGFKAGNFIKKRLQHRCFPVNIAKVLRTTFLIEHLRWLFLSVYEVNV